ncbi:zinc finger protein 62-like [Maniola jurtina]|uniref:zinc finger protein 62-like n=1 Tax=Maniola jurtina TaxID=191418 RepID=UPI001E686DF0|nr:zinc finger protein 62-like [Maniola jurtina]
MSKCRACLKSLRNMIPFDEVNIMYFNILTNLNLQLSTSDPQQLCKHCFKILQQFIEFREKCLAANAVFSDIIPEENIKQEHTYNTAESEVEVKLEPKTDDQEAKISFEDDITDDYFGDRELQYNDDNLTYELVLKAENKTEDNKFEEIKNSARKTKYAKKKALSVKNDVSKGIKQTKKTPKEKSSEPKSKSNGTKSVKPKGKSNDTTSETGLPCGLCTKSFEDNTQLDAHLLTHRQNYSCNICEEKLLDWQEVMSHRLTHLAGKKIPCHLCSKTFKSAMYIEHHFRKYHHTEGESQTLRCRLCDRACPTPRKLRVHFYDFHHIKNKRYYCDHCNKLCLSRGGLKVHIAIHSDNRPFKCDLCDATFKLNNHLRLHKQAKHNPDRVYCPRCHNVFASQALLDKHQCKYGDMICPECGKICPSRGQLTRHLRTHDMNRWYECTLCPARFRGHGALSVHRDKHSGVPRHECEFCHAKFYYRAVLLKHRRTHTGE